MTKIGKLSKKLGRVGKGLKRTKSLFVAPSISPIAGPSRRRKSAKRIKLW